MASRTIAYVTPLYFGDESYIGGGERYPLNLARGVAEATAGAFRVELISFGAGRAVREIAPGVTLRVLLAARPPRNPLDVVSWDLPEMIARADLVHVHQAYTRCSETAILVAAQQRKPICLTDHGGDSSSLGRGLGMIEMVDRIVAQSDFAASLFPKTKTPIEVIKGGIDAQGFRNDENDPRPRDRVVFVGRLLPHKGIDRLIAALPAGMPLTVCGRAVRADYFAYLKTLALGKNVTFVNDADDNAILDLYARAFAVVLPSVREDCYGNVYQAPELMGMSLLEGMAAGAPGLGARTTSIPEFIRQNETGFVFDDAEDLSTKLRLLAENPALVARMGREASRVVGRDYDLRAVGSKLADVYDRMLRRFEASREAAA